MVIVGVVLLCASLSTARTQKKKKNVSKREVTVSTKSQVSREGSSRKYAVRQGKSKSSARKGKTAARRPRGQQAIDSERAREIQQALIRERYLDGQPSGTWDDRTRQAMIRYQTDNGWQSKVVPDSRALIKLGLGPKYANLLNPESISASVPDSARHLQPGGSTLP